jgi:hypothetical protein
MVTTNGAVCLKESFMLSYLLTYFITYLLTYLLTHSLTHSTQHSPSWEANRFAASQEIPRILCNPNVHYRIYKCPPPVSILSQLNPVHTTKSYFLKVYQNIMFLSTPGSPQWSLSLRFHHQIPVQVFPFPKSELYVPLISIYSILSPAQYWVSSTDHEAPRYEVFSIPLLPRPC